MTTSSSKLMVKCKPYFKLRSRTPQFHPKSTVSAEVAAPPSPWQVPSLCAAYNWPTALPGNGVIAIVELGGGWVQPDMDAFFGALNQPSPQITDVSVDGTQNSPNQSIGSSNDPDYEVALDIQVAGASFFAATARAANIRMYWSQDIASAVQMAASDGCDVCSISWGADEAVWGTAAAQQMEQAAAAAAAAGMVIFAASGDNDSSDGGSSPANVDLPAACPHIVGCGGTYKTSSEETVWNDNPGQTDGEGTGGGYSTIFPAQDWQVNAPPPPTGTTAGTGRMVPDVAGDADPNTGYEVYVHGAGTVVGGTSAVAPLYAGLFASFGNKLGFINPTLWQTPDDFNDITVGDNGMYQAAQGPDPCTGLGSPIGINLSQTFSNQ